MRRLTNLVTVTVTTKDGFEVPAEQPTSDIATFVSTAKKNGVRPVFSIGGWDGSLHFSDLVKTSSKQAAFAEQIKTFMNKYGFAGVDLGTSGLVLPASPAAMTERL